VSAREQFTLSYWGHWADTWVRPYRKALSKKLKPEEVLQMKGSWRGGDGMSVHYRNPHWQGVSTTNERKKEETAFPLVGRKRLLVFVDSVIVW